ncbi:IMPACT family protein [Gordonia sp. HY002]|uniref:IMPACT family protein n=1 Tax=Gordonia zhenghanii TaxID=2911516 RepID=UPI001EF0F969|nr:YigZ family protein [Gordonia zhenghanii]MCF8570753.1 IMPACT family protein [Gordonia zhenghanii]MCF8605711.1 IMPACT family protein [Gordonia zhenghanii]
MRVLDSDAGEIVVTTTIKKSRFIATLAPVASPEEAATLVDRVPSDGANHVCWAYLIGAEPHQVSRSSDAGEPAGTAGPPILAALTGRNVVNAAIVVVRYFGGVKLGAGGLIRAYGGSATAVLDAAPLRDAVLSSVIRLTVPVDEAGRVATDLRSMGVVRSTEYGPVAVEFVVQVPVDAEAGLRDHVLSVTSGAAEILDSTSQFS